MGVNSLVEIDTESGEILKKVMGTNGNAGMIDLNSKGGFVYALSSGSGVAGGNGTSSKVVVFDVQGGRGSVKEVQNFELKGEGIGGSIQGMGIF